MRIDAFPHCLPRVCLDRFRAVASGFALDYLNGMEAQPLLAPLWDLDGRFRAMDQVEDYVQVLTICLPPIEFIAQGQTGADLARLANDEMAELVVKHPDRFRGFAASLAISEVDASLAEIERAVRQLGALGIQIHTNANGLPLDEPRFEPIFAAMEALDRPIWVHGWRSPAVADYAGEAESKYGLWLALGWPYEMGMFMGRLALSGMFDRHPNLRILTHHSGGMAPTFSQRASGAAMHFNPSQESDRAAVASLTKSPLDYFKMFYADTTGQTPITITAALQFFGIDRVMMATDFPWTYPAKHMTAIDQLSLSEAQRQQLLRANAQRVLGIK